MKRKISVIVLSFALVFGMSACTQEPETEKKPETVQNGVENVSEAEPAEEIKEEEVKEKEIVIGDVITLDFAEITIKNIEFSYDVLPDDTSSFYTHYPADSGKVFVHIDTDVKNMQKQSLPVDEFVQVEVDYNDGYKYDGEAIPEDTSTGFSYANITSIDPLETLGVRILADCPQEVVESENPVVVHLDFRGEKFFYKMK